MKTGLAFWIKSEKLAQGLAKFIEKVEGNKIILIPVIPLSKAGGMLKGMDKRPTNEIIKEIKRGWK